MAAVVGAAALLSQIPKWLWVLAASIYGGHLGLQGLTAYGQYGLGKQQIAAGVRGQELQAGIGRQEEERMDALVKQLLAHTEKGKAESREFEMLKMLISGGHQQTMMTTMLMQAAGQKPVRTGYAAPPASLMSLLR